MGLQSCGQLEVVACAACMTDDAIAHPLESMRPKDPTCLDTRRQVEHRSNIRSRTGPFAISRAPPVSRAFCPSATAGIRLVLLCTQGVVGSSPIVSTIVSTTLTRTLTAAASGQGPCVPSFCPSCVSLTHRAVSALGQALNC